MRQSKLFQNHFNANGLYKTLFSICGDHPLFYSVLLQLFWGMPQPCTIMSPSLPSLRGEHLILRYKRYVATFSNCFHHHLTELRTQTVFLIKSLCSCKKYHWESLFVILQGFMGEYQCLGSMKCQNMPSSCPQTSADLWHQHEGHESVRPCHSDGPLPAQPWHFCHFFDSSTKNQKNSGGIPNSEVPCHCSTAATLQNLSNLLPELFGTFCLGSGTLPNLSDLSKPMCWMLNLSNAPKPFKNIRTFIPIPLVLSAAGKDPQSAPRKKLQLALQFCPAHLTILSQRLRGKHQHLHQAFRALMVSDGIEGIGIEVDMQSPARVKLQAFPFCFTAASTISSGMTNLWLDWRKTLRQCKSKTVHSQKKLLETCRMYYVALLRRVLCLPAFAWMQCVRRSRQPVVQRNERNEFPRYGSQTGCPIA